MSDRTQFPVNAPDVHACVISQGLGALNLFLIENSPARKEADDAS